MPQQPTRVRQTRVTINDVADRAGVSKSTASRVLGGYGVASEDARDSVVKAAADLGYRVNPLARAMITGRTYTIGVVLADIENHYFARLARGAADAARAAGFEIVLANTDEDVNTERGAVRVLIDRQVDGLVVAAASSTEIDHLQQLRKQGTPLVLVDRRIPALKVDTVGIDDQAAARTAMDRLLDAGHRRIAIVTSAADFDDEHSRSPLSTGYGRVMGYMHALEAAGIALDHDLIRRGSYSTEAARAQTRLVMALPKPPTAIFASDDIMALGVLRGLQDLGIDIPGSVSVATLDDAEWAEVVTPPMSVVRQPVYEIGRLAVERLVERINGDASRPHDFQLDFTWVERASIAKRTVRRSARER